MDPFTLAVLAVGGLALLGGGRKGGKSSGGASGSGATKGKAERAAMLNEIRAMSFHYSNQFNSMPVLADYMVTIGFRESNFNPDVANPEIQSNPSNAARGLFGMRPQTAFQKANGLEHMRSRPNALLDPRWAFVTAVWGVHAACNRAAKAGHTPNYAAVRRWWAYPSLTTDYSLSKEKSVSNLKKLEKAIVDVNAGYGTKINPNFIWAPVRGWKNYPGMQTMLKVYGLA